MNSIVKIQDLTFGYKKAANCIFSHFSLSLQPGTVYGLLGKNGAGKSTLLYLICGLLRPRGGRVLTVGNDSWLRRPEMLRDVFIVPEEFELPAVSLDRYVELNAPFYPSFDTAILDRCLADFDMSRDIRLDELSMGQKKKAYMSFALAANTSLLVMDEPTNGFDIPSKSQMRKVIAASMSDTKTILISTHQVRDVENLLDHVLIIDNSRLMLDASCNLIEERLAFRELSPGQQADGVLYAQPSLHGQSVVVPNDGEATSEINLELLFNAVLADRNAITNQLNKENNGNNR